MRYKTYKYTDTTDAEGVINISEKVCDTTQAIAKITTLGKTVKEIGGIPLLFEIGSVEAGGINRELGRATVDFSLTTDQPICINDASKYIIRRIIYVNSSGVNMAAACGGIYSSPGKRFSIVSATQTYSNTSDSPSYIDLILSKLLYYKLCTEKTLYFSLTTVEATSITGTIIVYGDVIET